jgi:membrane fusion protein (multidrug efflux system)
MSSRLLVFSMLALPLAAGGGCRGRTDASQEKALAPPIPVQVMRVEPRSIARRLVYDADVQGELELKVFAQVAERIVSLSVEEGDHVKQGQTLATLRAESLAEGVRSAAAAVDAARADRDNLKLELERSQRLLARNIVSKAQVDGLRARLLAAEAQIRRLEAMTSQASTARSYTVIRSPVAGVVGRRYLSQGDLATPALPILTVVRLERVELVVELPEQDLVSVRPGMPATIAVARYPGRRFAGKVTLIAPTIDRQTRMARVKVAAPNRERALMPGMLAKVSLEVERRDGVLVVPYGGIVIESDREGRVSYRGFVVEAGRAGERTLAVGLIDGNHVEVTAGLRAGELMVVKGGHLLESGKRVEVAETVALPANGEPERPPQTKVGKP